MKKVLDFIKTHLFLLIASVLAVAIMIIVTVQFVSFKNFSVDFAKRSHVDIQKMSDYLPKLKGTIGDADIYVIGTQDENEPSVLVMGGIHPNEPAGQMATVLLMEQIDVTKGTVYIIVETNRSAYSHTHPQEATPMFYDVETPWGFDRTFKYGSRATNPVHQWPISDVYVHSATGQRLSGQDTRNINRSFPGNPNGNYTELMATAIINLINQKDIILVLDLHEASPEYGTNNAFVIHDKPAAKQIGGLMSFGFDMVRATDNRFAPIKLENSPTNLRGLTHREIGDNTSAIPVLAEASNVTQGRIRGPVTSENIVSGVDKFYERASALGILEVDHSSPVSLHERAARHVETFKVFIDSYNQFTAVASSNPEIAAYQRGSFVIDFKGLSFSNILDNGIGYYLRDPNDPDLDFWG